MLDNVYHKAPAQRLQHFKQHFNPIYRNIVGGNILLVFGHPLVKCYDMRSAVGSSLKIVKFSMQHLWTLNDVVVVWPGSYNNVAPGQVH